MQAGMQSRTRIRLKVTVMFVLAMAAAYIAGAGFSSGQRKLTQVVDEPERKMTKSASSIDLEVTKLDEKVEYRGGGRNIFRKLSEARPRPPHPVPPPHEKEQPPPSLPTIDLKFFGFATRVGHAMRVFLTEGEEVFVASEGEIVNRRYRIVRIGPSWVEIEDVLTNHSQNIPLTQG